MSELSFEVKQDVLAKIQNSVIEANFDECKAALTDMIQPYATMIVTEDGIAAAKADRAKIRKVESHIGEMRIAIKKAYMKPLDDFTEKCNELVEICANGSLNLDNQIRAFEDSERQRKIAALHNEYDALIDDDTAPYCPWETIFNEKWGNKTVSFDNAVAEIKAAVDNAKNDLEAIRSMGGDDTPYLLDVYKQTHNISTVVRKASELKTMREREEQRKREAEERQKEIERVKAESDVPKPQTEYSQAVTVDIEEFVRVTFRVVCTKQQLYDLGQYMKHHAIKYQKA